ncbi:hypothetical protein ACT3SQ_02825 [Brachybacterium sp. AOP42-C2-15]|uniref:hypothetical protein n=1 Tax=Brachybacterium sp. AOP42-C2-15 TaxID=3457670 RepID=UPI004034A965
MSTTTTLACYSCGAQANTHRRPLNFSSMWIEGQNPALAASARAKPRTIQLGECTECGERHALARYLVTGKRDGRDATVTTDRLGAALDGLAILGKPMPKLGDGIGSLLRHMSTPGSLARWAMRYAPTWTKGATKDEMNPSAWAHVSEEQMKDLREGYASVLAERVAATSPPTGVEPPAVGEGKGRTVEGACLFCGTTAVEVNAQSIVASGGLGTMRDRVWRPVSATTGALGSKHASEKLRGHLCPSCTESVEAVGAVGTKAMERAFMRHLKASGRGDDLPPLGPGEHLSGIVAWAVTERRRNGVPWDHLSLPRK